MSVLRGAARLVAWGGLTAVGVLHLAWASGSTWPERNRKRLGEAVVGSSREFPSQASTAAVGGVAVAAGAVAGGALGNGRAVVTLRRLIGAVLLARAVVGGEAAAAALGLPPVGRRFRRLDREVYRPLCATLGVAAIVGATSARRRISGD